tara:strand:+ start:18 stop:272 length:255 start_codon:yes stop_codon:yes gene_type:complete
MIEAVLIVICLISLQLLWGMFKYSKQKKKDERVNKQDFIRVNQKRESKSSSSSKVSKDKAPNKSKYKSSNKKNVKPKVKKNGKK